jgi:uncharacterized protein (DUF486 family)
MQFLQSLPVSAQTIGLLLLSNVFMTFAWYGHLKNLATSPWYVAALISWGIALFEYLLQVPGNRIGFTQFSVGQLKIMQEVITLTVFVPFAVFYLNEPLKLDYLWAALCMVGAVYFIFSDIQYWFGCWVFGCLVFLSPPLVDAPRSAGPDGSGQKLV